MLKEQQKSVETFKTCMADRRGEKLVLYGTGINAEAVVKNCPEYRIVGLMDAAKTGESFWGLRVLSENEIVEAGVKCIVVVARPAVLTVIYKRIQAWSKENRIVVCDIYGNNLEDRIKSVKKSSPYFEVSYEDLLREADRHEVISFDIFDTLMTRGVYAPEDVFSLLDLEYGDRLPFLFSAERKRAERELLKKGETDIYEIYHLIGEHYGLSPKETQSMLEAEIKKEKEVLLVRERMRECLQYCLSEGKKVYLISDMYLTQNILEDILACKGITGYDRLIVSCSEGCSKQNGLYSVLKEETGAQKWLHIGDNHEADYLAAREAGGDAFEILAPVRMMEISAYDVLLSDLKNRTTRIMLGMLAAKAFNDPFILYHSDGKPRIGGLSEFGYLFIAPLIAAFMVWMLSVMEKGEDKLLLFSARDGWLLQKVYRIFEENDKRTVFPKDFYLLISRKAMNIVMEEDRKEERDNYLNYLKQLELEKYKIIYFFDFMSRGTCQSKLEDLIKRELQGVYFQKSLSGDERKDSIRVLRFFKEQSALEKDLRIFAMCDFLECILSSPDPSFWKIDHCGEPVYEEEQRSKKQIENISEIHEGILKYCEAFVKVMGKVPFESELPELCDKILRLTESAASRVEIPELLEFELDDVVAAKKNTGKDVLA